MQKLMGTTVYGGIGRGVIKYFHRDEIAISKARVVDTMRELRKFAYARNEVEEELKKLYEQSVPVVGEDEALVVRRNTTSGVSCSVASCVSLAVMSSL